MHLTIGWLLCQKMRLYCPCVIVVKINPRFVVVVAVVIIVAETTPLPCQECTRPQVGYCVEKCG